MFSKLYVSLVLLSCIANPGAGNPIITGRSEDYSTHPVRENLSQDPENVVEDSEINKIVAFANLPVSTTADALEENDENLLIVNSIDQNQTSVPNMQEILEEHEALQNHPKFKGHIINDLHSSELITSTSRSESGNKVLINESPVNVEATTPVQFNPEYELLPSKISQVGGAFLNENQMHSNHDPVIVESVVTTTNSDYEDLQNENDMEGSMNEEDDELLQIEEDEDALPSVLKNLPHDIPPDRTIYEVLAENIVKDKQYDEFRIEELIHELMDHYDTHNGLGEVYAGEADYDEKARPANQGNDYISQSIETSTALP